MTDKEIKGAVGFLEYLTNGKHERHPPLNLIPAEFEAIKVLLNLAQDYLAVREEGLEEKEEVETCTKCGGLGRTPNHPHIVAHLCEKCAGHGKIRRPDYTGYNAALRVDAFEVTLSFLKRARVEKIEKIIEEKAYFVNIKWGALLSKSCRNEVAQAIHNMLMGKEE